MANQDDPFGINDLFDFSKSSTPSLVSGYKPRDPMAEMAALVKERNAMDVLRSKQVEAQNRAAFDNELADKAMNFDVYKEKAIANIENKTGVKLIGKARTEFADGLYDEMYKSLKSDKRYAPLREHFTANTLKPSEMEALQASTLKEQAKAAKKSSEGSGFLGGVGDVALSLGQSLVGLGEIGGRLVGANDFAGGAANVKEWLQTNKTEASQAERKKLQEAVAKAEKSGSTKEEVFAYLDMFKAQPLEFLAETIGPTLGIGALARAGGKVALKTVGKNATEEAAKRAAMIGATGTGAVAGAAFGVGEVKGNQYETTYNEAVSRGFDDATSKALAEKASEYSLKNAGQQALGAGLGAVGVMTGPLDKLIMGTAAKAGAKGLAARTAAGVAIEGGTEALQEGQGKYAGNVAAIDAGVMNESDLFKGVAGSAALGGAVGGTLGGLSGAVSSDRTAQLRPDATFETDNQPVAPPSATLTPQQRADLRAEYATSPETAIKKYADLTGQTEVNATAKAEQDAALQAAYDDAVANNAPEDVIQQRLAELDASVNATPEAAIASLFEADISSQESVGENAPTVAVGTIATLPNVISNGKELPDTKILEHTVATLAKSDPQVLYGDGLKVGDAKDAAAIESKVRGAISVLEGILSGSPAYANYDAQGLSDVVAENAAILQSVHDAVQTSNATRKLAAKTQREVLATKAFNDKQKSLKDADVAARKQAGSAGKPMGKPQADPLQAMTTEQIQQELQSLKQNSKEGAPNETKTTEGGQPIVETAPAVDAKLPEKVNASTPNTPSPSDATSVSATTTNRVSATDSAILPATGSGATVQTKPAVAQQKNETGLTSIQATPDEILAEQRTLAKEARRKRMQGMSNALKSYREKSPFLAWLIENGIDKKEQSEWKDFNPAAIGYGPLFRRNGKNLDNLMELAVEDGYLPPNTNDQAAIYDLISRQANGESIAPIYTEDGATNVMQKAEEEREAEYQDYLDAIENEKNAADEALSDFLDSDLQAVGYYNASDELKAEVAALHKLAESKGIDAEDWMQEAARLTTGATENDYLETAKTTLANAIEKGIRDVFSTPSTQSDAQGEGKAETGLTTPTRADVLAQQDRIANATALDAQQQAIAENQAQPLVQQTAPDQRTDNTSDMFALEKAQAEIAKANEGKAVEVDPNQGAMFNTPDSQYNVQNGQYSEQSTAANPRQIERLNSSGVAGVQFGNVPSFVSRPINSYLLDGRIFGELAAALGSRIAGFATNPVLTTEQRAQVRKFNGVFVDGTIYIREGTDRPNLAVLGHEFGHLLRKNNPSLYAELIKAIQPYVNQKQYAGFRDKPVARGLTDPNAIKEEFIGEVFSDGFMDEGFWQAVASKDVGTLSKVIGSLKSLIDTIKATVGYTPKTKEFLSDYDTVMSIAGKTLASYTQANGSPLGAQLSQSTTTTNPSNPTDIRKAIEGIFSGMKDAWAMVSKSTVVIESDDITADMIPVDDKKSRESAQAFYQQSTGKIYLIADRIEKGTEASVWLHEVFHKRGEELLGKENFDKLYDNVQSWKTRKPDSVERQIYEAANERASASTAVIMPENVLIIGRNGLLSASENYTAAKNGDVIAAIEVINETLSKDDINKIANEAKDSTIVPVINFSEKSANRIPQAMAIKIHSATGLPYDVSVLRKSPDGRTTMNGIDRLFDTPKFNGEVVRGKKYYLLDDTVTMGGTLAAMSKYITDRGGIVTGAAVMTGQERSSTLAITPETQAKLRKEVGELEGAFYEETGRRFDELTNSEAGFILRDVGKFRANLAARGNGQGDGNNAQSLQRATYQQEFITYAIEEANNLGVKPDASKGTITAAGWMAKVKSLFINALRKLLGGYAGNIDLSANDLMAMAYGAAKLEYEGKTAGAQGDGIQFSLSEDISKKVDKVISNSQKAIESAKTGAQRVAALRTNDPAVKTALLARFSQMSDIGRAAYIKVLDQYAVSSLFKDYFKNPKGDYISQVADLVSMKSAEVAKNMARFNTDLMEKIDNTVDRAALEDVMDKATFIQYDPSGNTPKKTTATTAEEKALKAQYEKLSPQAKQVYRDVLRSNRDQFKRLIAAVGKTMDELGVDTAQSKALQEKMKLGQIDVYFAQNHGDGNYVVFATEKGKADHVFFRRYESKAEAEAEKAALAKENPSWTVSDVTAYQDLKKPIFNASTEDMLARFEARLKRDGKSDAEVSDAVQSMRDVISSAMVTKTEAMLRTRKNIAGARKDIKYTIRSFTAMESLIAKVKHQHKINKTIADAQKHIEANDGKKGYDKVAAQQALDAIRASVNFASDKGLGSQIADKINMVGYLTTIAANISSPLVNLTSLTNLALPDLGAKYGFAKAAKMMLVTAFKDVQANFTKQISEMTGDLKIVAEHAEKMNRDHFSNAKEMLDLANNTSPTMSKVMYFSGWMQSQSERAVNLQVMLTAYKLEMDRSGDQEKALAESIRAVNKGNPSNAAITRGAFAKSNIGRVVLMLKTYQINVLVQMVSQVSTVWKAAKDSGDPVKMEEARVAGKNLAGILIMHGITAGVIGLPYAVMVTLGAALQGAFGDEEDKNKPYDEWLKDFFYKHLGKENGSTLFYGILGAGISKRIGIGDLIFQERFAGRNEHEYVTDYVLQALGAGVSNINEIVKTISTWNKEREVMPADVANERAIKRLPMPAVSNILKGLQFQEDGGIAYTKDGTPLNTDENRLTGVDMLLQAIGFRPSTVAEATADRNAAYKVVTVVKAERAALLKAYKDMQNQLLRGVGSEEHVAEVEALIDAFNERFPAYEITEKSIKTADKKVKQQLSSVIADFNDKDEALVDDSKPWIFPK